MNLYFGVGSAHKYNIRINLVHKRKGNLTRKVRGSKGQGGSAGRGVCSLRATPIERWCGDETLRGRENQRPTCLNDNPKETWCRCASALNPRSCLKGTKAFPRAKPNTRFITWLVHFEETLNTEKPFTQKTFSNTICELKGKTPSLTSGKVTLGSD